MEPNKLFVVGFFHKFVCVYLIGIVWWFVDIFAFQFDVFALGSTRRRKSVCGLVVDVGMSARLILIFLCADATVMIIL